MKFATKLLHGSFDPDAATGSVTQPLYQTSAFYQETAEDMANVFAGCKPGFVYTRVNNPTVMSLERRINGLEGGAGAVAFASGMAAVSHAVLNVLSSGDELVASGGLYGGTSSFFRDLAHYGITVRYAAGDRAEDFAAVMTARTKLLYVETIGNPKLDVPDLAALSELAPCARRAAFRRQHRDDAISLPAFVARCRCRPSLDLEGPQRQRQLHRRPRRERQPLCLGSQALREVP